MMKSKPFLNTQWVIGTLIAVAIICGVLSVVLSDIFGKKGSGLGKEFQYDLEQIRKIDPALLLYEETGLRFDTGLNAPHAVAIDSSNNIYVGGGKELCAFSSAGQKLPFHIPLTGELSALTVSEDGTLYLGIGNRIEVYGPTGEVSQWESAGSKAFLTSIAVYQQHVFAADFGNREIIHYDTSGNKTNTFGDFVIPSPYFDLAISPDGFVQVAHTGEHRIESFNFDGNLMSWWGEFSIEDAAGFCGCCNPVNFALLPDNQGFVTCEKGLTRIKIYDREGKFLGFVAGPDHFTQHDNLCNAPDFNLSQAGLDVAVDSKGQVLILDSAVKEIRGFRRIEKSAPQL